MARFVETFKDWIVSFPNRYKIIEDGQEKTVEIERDWEPDVEGTSNNERVMNELVKNITYDTDTVHTTESGTSVYICDLVGMKEFTEYSSSDSSFIPKISARINTTNSNQLSKIRISGKDGSVSDYDLYTINNGVYSLLGANKLKPNTIVIIKIVSNGANKIAVVQYLMDDKLDKGTYPGNASNLKTEIDGKMDKYKNVMETVNDYDDLIEDGFYILNGYSSGIANSPHLDATLVQVWTYAGLVYQHAVSPYDVLAQFTRCFEAGFKNTKWEKIVNTANYSLMCPYSIGDLMFSVSSQHPAVRWVGTTWEKIEGRFLLATSGSNASGQTGGSNTKTISKANLPNVKVQVDSFTLTTQPHTHPYVTPIVQWVERGGWDGQGWSQHITSTTGTGGGQNTGTAAPYTSALGSGTPLDITPAYYTVHIWKRLS